ncbi:MAG: GNAT family protein [Maribacter sp.]
MINQVIKLRPLKAADKFQLAQLANNKKIYDNVRDHFPYPYNEDDAKAFINTTIEEDPKQNFGIEYEGNICGAIGLILQKDVYRKSAEMGYWIGEPYWGKGFATKAIELITEYGFDNLNLLRIYAGVFDFNIASMKVLEKNGFKKEGISRDAVLKNGRIRNEHRYYKLKKE